jgi:hypothetical protein
MKGRKKRTWATYPAKDLGVTDETLKGYYIVRCECGDNLDVYDKSIITGAKRTQIKVCYNCGRVYRVMKGFVQKSDQ